MSRLEAPDRSLAEVVALFGFHRAVGAETARPFRETAVGRASVGLLTKFRKDYGSAATIMPGEKEIIFWWEVRPNEDMGPGFQGKGIALYPLQDGVGIRYTGRTENGVDWIDYQGWGVPLRHEFSLTRFFGDVDLALEVVRSAGRLAVPFRYR
ncbi:hypothetical protein HYT17_03485 [Candidatus Microgenomates bacterium]|nr:hypothetical protein [Candidatus Microgenomates bacterium]